MSSRIKSDVRKLFEFWCEVALIQNADRNSLSNQAMTPADIIESFPEGYCDKKTMLDIPAFAFPCKIESDSVQFYSFVLTTDDSKWRFGFCRHDPKTDTAMVLITYLPWHDTFLRLLALLAELRRSDNNATDEFRSFIAEVYSRGVPDPGKSVKVYYNGGQNNFVLERPLQFQLPSIPENHNLNLYYNFVDPKNMIDVFAAMLAERRIIFTSRRLDRLSSCIQAANAFLYPMVWQHIFIPVLPMKLKDYLSAPMPYLIGVPQIVLDTMTPEELGDVVILNCDKKCFESPFDDVREMPADIVSHMKKQLSHSHEHIGDRVSKIFLGVLVQLISGYRDAVEFRGVGKTFNRRKFIESRPKHLRPFLTKMMDLQIFQQFIDERLQMLNTGLGYSDEFEVEAARFSEKMKKRRHYEFLNNVREKTNPAVKSAVKSVKEGSRGVKSAYKDLKSKFRDITPPNNSTPRFRSHLASHSRDRADGTTAGNEYAFSVDATYVRTKSIAGHHSAPSSPIFGNKRAASGATGGHSSTATCFKYASPEDLNDSNQYMRRAPPLAMSTSSTHIRPNGSMGNTHGTAHLPVNLAPSPTVSPAGSLCLSEMNLSQELQNHPLFKPPHVDRSSLRSLQTQHLLKSTAPSSTSSQEDTMNDLITLEDSHNASFEIEDFDPLNPNARPLPLRSGSATASSAIFNSIKSVTLPANTNALSNTSSTISNPLYPFHTPQHLISPHTRAQPQLAAAQLQDPPSIPPPLPTSQPPPMPARDEDFELLRRYGLDHFTLIPASTTLTTTTTMATTASDSSDAAASDLHNPKVSSTSNIVSGRHNWTKFE
ncbi:DENN domain-containing protein 1A-like isoform X6 [Anastrepha obliqua]|uniref:DENN domain-containing protein 1A-like isoform X6 n=1 Tax=Anastrepha obliqua TaxID=95512 RepID=UPI0024095082|nr:DENN domain-containing protein 1A-like isoform X6 [Anastrepha obliqua]